MTTVLEGNEATSLPLPRTLGPTLPPPSLQDSVAIFLVISDDRKRARAQNNSAKYVRSCPENHLILILPPPAFSHISFYKLDHFFLALKTKIFYLE